MNDLRCENLFANIPVSAPQELCENLLNQPGIRIERILSFGQASPQDFWYEQETAEWVVLLQGAARLWFDGQENPNEMLPGDFVNIPARVKHRVEWTSAHPPAVWLAIHYTAAAPHSATP